MTFLMKKRNISNKNKKKKRKNKSKNRNMTREEDKYEVQSDIQSNSSRDRIEQSLSSSYLFHQEVCECKKYSKLYSNDLREYIVKNTEKRHMMYSGQFYEGDLDIEIHSNSCLLTSQTDNFVARIKIKDQKQIDFSKPFNIVKRQFFENLEIIKILDDDLLEKRYTAFSTLNSFVQCRSTKTVKDLKCAEDIYQCLFILEESKKSDQPQDIKWILHKIINNNYISSELKDYSTALLAVENESVNRNKMMPKFGVDAHADIKYCIKGFQKTCFEGCDNHRNELSIVYNVSNEHRLTHGQVFYLNYKDMNLFSELVDACTADVYLQFIDNLQKSFFMQVANMPIQSSLSNVWHLTNGLYLYLFRSLQELIAEISSKTELTVNDLFYVDQGEWRLAENINWKSQSPLTHSLEQQYYFIFQLMKHFAPGANSLKLKFDYKFKLLPSSMEQSKSLKQRFMNWLWQSDTSSALPEERLVWMYILDNAVYTLFSTKKIKKSLFEPLTLGYMDFIRNAESNNYESFRVGTHNIIRFIAQTVDKVNNYSRCILSEQIESLWKSFDDNISSDFRELVDVYNTYWENTESIIEKVVHKFPYWPFKRDMETIRQELYNISTSVMDKDVDSGDLVTFFRSFNDFLDEICAIEFNWFVKEDLAGDEVQVVNEAKKSYEIINPEQFIRMHSDRPRHYIIEVITELIHIVVGFLQEATFVENEIVNAASDLLLAIRKSFCYLKDQPNYVSFDLFKDESTKPFACIVQNCISYDDFQKRINTLGESFWYLRKQDEIDIDKAVEFYNEVNENDVEESLRYCYDTYLRKFNKLIEETFDKKFEDKIKYIIDEIEQTLQDNGTDGMKADKGNRVKVNEPIKIADIRLAIKKEILPELLAELGALWSIQESKDIANTGKSFKPHCIQILCILRLLSVDTNADGVDKHLAQVLTGQGKSLVLGLLSAILALLGYKVRVVCYSKYLATRDEQDFMNFFMTVGIWKNIMYGTFEEMAEEVMNPKINGREQSLRQLVKNLILHNKNKLTGRIKVDDISNTVLLIDEVDVFFSDEFYGNVMGAGTFPRINSLYNVQEKMWEMACKKYDHSTILKEVEIIDEFNKLEFATAKYNLLKYENGLAVKKEYNTTSLYQEELKEMIRNAIDVANGSYKDLFRYKLNDDGLITYMQANGEYSASTYDNYYNIFNYFRLASKPYNKSEYGYLNIPCGRVSYAKLPEKYPLILGVSGTLATLNDYEKEAVREYYSINKCSLMPSFFGDSHLQFCTTENVYVQDTEEQWFKKIYNHTNSRIGSGQSVLVFFDTEIEINKFYEKYRANCDRLQILTENTKKGDKKKYIDDAGIAKTITLATRGMGRGIDFKSSVTVEKNGGVHVIQTFFSIDIKEETQIKGRTARKDNKGSYELILCKAHLISAGFLTRKKAKTTVYYADLHEARKQKVKEKGLRIDENIKRAADNHKTTMDYFESLLKN